MPTDFVIDAQHGVVFSAGTGVFVHADFMEHMTRLEKAADFNPAFNHVADCRGFTKIELNAGEIRDLATLTLFSPKSRRAFVVSSELHFGMTRMFAAYREIAVKQENMVFRDMPSALRWLNLPEDLKD